MKLRSYQKKMIDDTRSMFIRGLKSVLMQLCTGGGKTFIAGNIIKPTVDNGKAAFFIVHRKELIIQSVAAFEKMGIETGVISAGFKPNKNAPLQVCSIQSLRKRKDTNIVPDITIWDEAHILAAKCNREVFSHYDKSRKILLTATPIRLDGQGLDEFAQAMVQGPTMRELIDMGNLSEYRAFAPTQLSMQNVGIQMGDFKKKESAEVVDKPTITGSAIKEFKKLCPDGRAIVFAITIEHSENIAQQFNDAGIPAKHVDGNTNKKEREQAIEDLRSGKIQVISNVGLFAEGLDVPALDALIMLRPTTSLGMYLQMVGRALRTAPGKECAYILDHVGNIQRHGMPCDHRPWTLRGREKGTRSEKDGIAVKVCTKCFAVQPPGKPSCIYCGGEYVITQREIDEREGELVELKKKEEKERKLKEKKEKGMARTLEDLEELGKSRGYKHWEAWASHVYNNRRR